MRTLAANLNFSTDTFNTAFTNINLLLDAMKNEVLTANSTNGSTTGNASLSGTFTGTTLVATTALRGGNVGTSNTLTVSSNVIFSSLVNVNANVAINATTTAVGNVSLSGNSTVAVFLVTGNTTISEATLNGTNLKINSNVIANGSVTISNTTSITGNTSINGNSTVLGLAVTTNSTATNVYVGGTTLRVNVTSTFVNSVSILGDASVTGNLTVNSIVNFVGANTNMSSNLFLTPVLVKLGNTTVNTDFTVTGNVGIKNTAPASALHVGGNFTAAQTNLGTINSTSNNTISLATGNYFRGTIGGAVTLTFSGFPANCSTGFIMAFANVGSNITWPAAVKWAGGTVPTFSSNTDIITFVSHDSGTTVYGALSIKDAR